MMHASEWHEAKLRHTRALINNILRINKWYAVIELGFFLYQYPEIIGFEKAIFGLFETGHFTQVLLLQYLKSENIVLGIPSFIFIKSLSNLFYEMSCSNKL